MLHLARIVESPQIAVGRGGASSMPPQHRNRHRDERAVRAKAVRPPCNDPQRVC